MCKLVVIAIFVVSLPLTMLGQTPSKFEAEKALAKLALDAHGGEKLRTMKSLILRGSADVTASAFNQAMPATFIIILSRDKYRIEITHPFMSLRQAYDGVNTSTTIRSGMTLPPVNRLGFPLLPMIGEPGFVITSLPATKKKQKGFRMTAPDGYYTDFYLNEKTNQIKGYDSSYDIAGRTWTTSVEIDKYRTVDGIVVPEKYAQRFESEQVTVYADFKAKEVLVNSAVENNVFSF